LHRLPGCDGDGELLGPREPQAATEIVDLPLRPPADAEVRAGARSSEREGRSPGYCCCSIEDDGNHNARPRLSCVGPAAAREASGGRARVREEGGGAASLTRGSDGGEQQVDDNHDARPWLVRVGPAAAREASGRQGGGACEEGGGAARLTHGSDGGERQWI